MIRGFESYTQPITKKEEKFIVPIVVNVLRKAYQDDKKIKSLQIAKKVQKAGHSIQEPTVRKIIHYIRVNGLLPVLSSSEGYYISKDISKINACVESLTQRADAIMEVAYALERQKNKLKKKK